MMLIQLIFTESLLSEDFSWGDWNTLVSKADENVRAPCLKLLADPNVDR